MPVTCHACGSPTHPQSAQIGENNYLHFDACENHACPWSLARTHFDFEQGRIDLEGNPIRRPAFREWKPPMDTFDEQLLFRQQEELTASRL